MRISFLDPDGADATIDPGGAYAEEKWLPVVGPNAWVLARRASQLGPGTIEDHELAHGLGLAPESVRKAAKRLRHFKLAEWSADDNTLGLKDLWTPIPDRFEHHVKRMAGMTKKNRERAGHTVDTTMNIGVTAAPGPEATVDPAGLFAEDQWLPVVGPTAWLLSRRVITLGNRSVDGDALARGVGVPFNKLRDVPVRLARYGLAQWYPAYNGLLLHERWSPVTTGQQEAMRQFHRRRDAVRGDAHRITGGRRQAQNLSSGESRPADQKPYQIERTPEVQKALDLLDKLTSRTPSRAVDIELSR